MNSIFEEFLQDVAQGIFGENELTYTDIYEYEKRANKEDLQKLSNFLFLFHETDEPNIPELMKHIKEVNGRNL